MVTCPEFIAIDPFPQERIDKLKKALKIEIKNEIYNASPLLRKRKDTSVMDSADDLDAKQMQELSAMSGQNNGPDIAEHIAKVMESTQKKLDKLDEHIAEREKVMEAKLRRTMKEDKDKNLKRINKVEDSLKKVSELPK